MEDREFVVGFRRRWPLWTLLVVSILYFAGVIALVATGRQLSRNVPNQWLVWGGAALFAILLIAMLPLLFTRRPRAPEPSEPMPGWQDEPPEPVSAPASRAFDDDDEKVVTGETQQGLKVLEYSRPAKSANKGAVYAKTYVPVTKEHVLRVETLAAEPREL